MKTDKEYNDYLDYINDTYNKQNTHVLLTCENACTVLNANKTHDRDADGGFYWIDFWRAMTGIHDRRLSCSSCGKAIISGFPTLSEHKEFTNGGDTPSKHKAEGGHIWIEGTDEYPGGRYITPLCPKCNEQRGEHIPIISGSMAYKELGANVVDKK